MQATQKYIIPDLIGLLGTRSFILVCLCATFPMTPNGDPAVGVIQGDVFMSWEINISDTTLAGSVQNPNGSTIIYFSPMTAKFTVTPAFSNRVKDNGSSIFLGRISFRLLNLTVADAGIWNYRLSDTVNGNDAGGQVLVIAGYPANISVMLVSDPLENEKYTMRCSAQSTSVPLGMGLTMHYQWKRENGRNITVSDRYSFSSDKSNLLINPLKRQDDGTFVCEAWEHVGAVSQSAPFSLKVIYGPDPGSIHLLPNRTSHELTESSSLTVNCSADCFPDCQYKWTGLGGNIVSSTCLLSFISIGRNQSGKYTCTALNSKSPIKTATAAISVSVFYGPDDRNVSLSPSNTSYQLIELSRLDVNCSATCEPQCNYQWSGPGLVSQSDSMGWLSISQIQRNQNGTFICTVTNPKALGKSATVNFSVLVYYGPDFNGINLSPSNTSYQLTELSPLNVQCSATCVPECIYQWMGPGISQNDNNGLLSVSKISKNHAGTFACTVTNPRMPGKSATANVSLIVYYPPVLTMKASNTSKGGRVVINCTASGVPDNYTFYKLTHMAPDVSRTIVRDLELTRVSNSAVSFTIEGATYQDTGFYVCKASNGIIHYNSGQLVMEDIVSVWITDQPVITSNTRDFYAEKGKSDHMYIEFYSGLSQPLVTWYLDNNGTMEPLQNSSNFGICLSTVTVELQYHRKTVRLPGYNASLKVFYVYQELFTSYKVEINDSFAQPVFETLELKPRGPPETPASLIVVPDSVTTHSLQLTWQAGFHGGGSQTFVIEYREAGKAIWLNKEEPRGLVQFITLNATITDLKDGTRYEFRIYSKNLYDRSQISSVINETTKIVPSLYESPESSVAGIAGGISAGLVIILVIGLVLVLWKRNQHNKHDTDNDATKEPRETRRSPIKANSVKQDVAVGSDYEGLHFKEAEANQYLQLNGITLEENRNINIRSPESDSYEKLQPYANSDIQMYSTLKIPKTSKDSLKYENTWIISPDTNDEIQNQI